MIISKAIFIKSASKLDECTQTEYPEIAVIGRSNVGKSTLINMITNNKQLAKASNTPGKTKLMNFFLINDTWQLVDLPGYGYAKSGIDKRMDWLDNMRQYFINRQQLKRVLVLVDANIPTQKIDLELINILETEGIPFDIVMTKIDKSSQKDLNKNINLLKKDINQKSSTTHKIILSSGIKNKGKDAILNHIEQIINESVDFSQISEEEEDITSAN